MKCPQTSSTKLIPFSDEVAGQKCEQILIMTIKMPFTYKKDKYDVGLLTHDCDIKEMALKGSQRNVCDFLKVLIIDIFQTNSQLHFNTKYADSCIIYSIWSDITAGLSRPL